MELNRLDTEKRNPDTEHIDELSTLEMAALINREDRKCAEAVGQEVPNIALAIDTIHDKLRQGGRLFYIGAGTSGRLGVLDAAECPPTFGVDPALVVAIIAGGERAVTQAAEGAEDDREAGGRDLERYNFCGKDALVGIAASGRTPYVIGAMDHARACGAPVIALTCCRDSEMSRHADITIAPVPGPEVITGSSRLKSGTCQKMVLNMLSTGVMIRLGKVYGNLMVDVKPTNEKLKARAERIVRQATGAGSGEALRALGEAGDSCKTAIVMLEAGVGADEARELLRRADGHIAKALAGGIGGKA